VRARVGSTDRAILRLAVPALGALAVDPLLTLADTAFVARLGVVDLAALGVDTAIFGFAFFGFNFLAYVTTPLVARALGRGKDDEARRWVGDALLLAVGLGALMTLTLEVAAPALVDLMGASAEVAGPAVAYLRIRALATPAVLVVMTGHGAFRGHKDTKTPLAVAAGVNGLNLVLDPILIFALGLGLEGAALATVVAQYAGAAWFLRLMQRRRMAKRTARFSDALPSLMALGRRGALLTARTGFLLAALTVAASKATRIGPEEIAAHQLVAQLFLLTAMLADSFAIAAQALVGESAGKGDTGPLRALVRRLCWWGAWGAGITLAVFVYVGRHGLAMLAADEAVADLTVRAGGAAAAMQPVGALVFVADGIFLGLLALGTMVASTGTGAAAAVGLMLFTDMGESLTGIWWTIAVMMVMRGAAFVAGYRRSVEIAVRS